jgi:hypothetical protein
MEAALSSGKNVLVESLMMTPESLLDRFESYKIIKAFAYCPLEIALERLRKRNEEALTKHNYYSKRFLKQVLLGYQQFYSLSRNSSQFFTSYLVDDLLVWFDRLSTTIVQNCKEENQAIFALREFNLLEFNRFRTEFIPSSLQSFETLFLEPKKEYDIILYTGNTTPSESALQLLDLLHNLNFMPECASFYP